MKRRLMPGRWIAVGAALALFAPMAANAQRGRCLTEEEVDRVVRPQIESGRMLIDVSSIDDGRPLCNGGTVQRYIHRVREQLHPEEREDRLARESSVRASIAEIAREEEASRARLKEAERLEQLARIAEAKRDAALADAAAANASADASEARLRNEKALRKLTALPPLRRQDAVILLTDDPTLDRQLEQAVLADSQSWWWNRFERGSMHDSSFLRMYREGTYDALGHFRYIGGGTGWVMVRFDQGRILCLEFHNDGGECRELGNSLSQRRAWDMAGNLFWAFALKRLGLN